MAVRVTAAEVREIIDTDLADIDAFITAANVFVDEYISGESAHSADTLKEVERWLAAHFVAIRDPRIKAEGTDGTTATYHGQSGMGLKHTPYGQQAIVLDISGKLATIGKRPATLQTIEAIDITVSGRE